MSPYPENWDSLRRQVYQRDDYTCGNCGDRGGPHGNAEIHAHHIVPLKNGGSDELTNLRSLCKTCHMAAHDRGMARTGTRALDEVPPECPECKGEFEYDSPDSIRCENCGEVIHVDTEYVPESITSCWGWFCSSRTFNYTLENGTGTLTCEFCERAYLIDVESGEYEKVK